MIRSTLSAVLFAITPSPVAASSAQQGPYRILADKKVGGTGSYDYVYADEINRKLYIPRLGGADSRLTIFDLDTLAPAGEIAETGGHGVAIDQASHHGFVSSSPVVMFDARHLRSPSRPSPSRAGPTASSKPTDASTSSPTPSPTSPCSTPRTAASSAPSTPAARSNRPSPTASGHLFIDLEDKAAIAVIDAAKMQLTGKYDLSGKGDGCAGLAIDRKTDVLFAACSEPNVMVMLSARDGSILTTLPIGKGAPTAPPSTPPPTKPSPRRATAPSPSSKKLRHQLRGRADPRNSEARPHHHPRRQKTGHLSSP